MCAPLEGGAGESNAARLRRQAAAEAAFFAEHMPEEAAAGRATSGALVEGLSGMFLQHVRAGWAPATLQRLEAALETARREDAALGVPALGGGSAEEVERARRLAAEAVRANITRGYGEAGQACCREMLEPLKRRLAGLVPSEGAAVRAEEAADAWGAEAAGVVDACREAAGRWREWWVGRAWELVVREAVGGDGSSRFAVERFPAYVEAVLARAAAAASAAAAEAEAAAVEAVRRFYDDASPWARFMSDLGAAPATVRVQRDVGQLVERVVVVFLRGGRAVREGLAAAAAEGAGEVGDWAEACGEERRRLAERMERVEAAKMGVVRGLGYSSAEDLMAAVHAISAAAHNSSGLVSLAWGASLQVTLPVGVCIDRDGNILVSSNSTHSVHVFKPDGSAVRTIGKEGSGTSQFSSPNGIATDVDGNIIVADPVNHRVQVFRPDGAFVKSFGTYGSGAGQMWSPNGVAVDRGGCIAVSEYGNHRVQVFRADGSVVRSFGSQGSGPGQLNGPYGVAFDGDGNIVVADCGNHRVQVFRPDGTVARCFGSAGAGPGQLQFPIGVALDAEGNIIIAEHCNHRVQVFGSDGRVVRSFGSPGAGPRQLKHPYGVAVDVEGKILVTDYSNNRVQVI
jgi:DNA-binding beta-propeller fold protein YncE